MCVTPIEQFSWTIVSLLSEQGVERTANVAMHILGKLWKIILLWSTFQMMMGDDTVCMVNFNAGFSLCISNSIEPYLWHQRMPGSEECLSQVGATCDGCGGSRNDDTWCSHKDLYEQVLCRMSHSILTDICGNICFRPPEPAWRPPGIAWWPLTSFLVPRTDPSDRTSNGSLGSL